VKITLRVKFTILRVEITLMRVEIALVRVKITQIPLITHSKIQKKHSIDALLIPKFIKVQKNSIDAKKFN
jgi:hypothetical protein